MAHYFFDKDVRMDWDSKYSILRRRKNSAFHVNGSKASAAFPTGVKKGS